MNLLGIDFEEWFHIELIQHHLNPDKPKTLSVINSIDKILAWLQKNDTYATFFMVGELLNAKPELLDKILEAGHEIGFHTMHHTRLDSSLYNQEILESELKEFDSITSHRSHGFRAPSFSLSSLTAWAVDVLVKNNYTYDSSVMPVKTRLYGVPNAECKPYRIASASIERDNPNGKLVEFPLLTTKILGRTIPAAGGFYLRFLPLRIIERAIHNSNHPIAFYIHSWELVPEFMPKVDLPLQDAFITYYKLHAALSKMDRLLRQFRFTSFERFIHNINFDTKDIAQHFHV